MKGIGGFTQGLSSYVIHRLSKIKKVRINTMGLMLFQLSLAGEDDGRCYNSPYLVTIKIMEVGKTVESLAVCGHWLAMENGLPWIGYPGARGG